MLVFDFSVGAGRTTSVFEQAGDDVYTWDINVKFDHADTQAFLALTPEFLLAEYGRPDFVWASPPMPGVQSGITASSLDRRRRRLCPGYANG